MKTIYPFPSAEAETRIEHITKRSLAFSGDLYQQVAGYVEDVRVRGDAALVEYTNQFDAGSVTLDSLEVTPAEFDQAMSQVGPDVMDALDQAISQLQDFHQRQVQNSWITTPRKGVTLGQKVLPVESAGLYAPGAKGGKTPLVSSVLMGAIPARVAGVKTITLMTPPMKDGRVNPHILVAAKKTGVTHVFKAGSSWAIAALAYGTNLVPRADVIAGPGNMYVTLAKKIVSGMVGIDMIAGPSEILILADETANPAFIAADLLSQAEHDPVASAILVTTSSAIAQQVMDMVAEQVATLPRKEIAGPSLADFGGIFLVPDMETGIELANRLAPEHLEMMAADPFDYLDQIRNAGAVFLGAYTPEPVGDYIAGPNHVLPTVGTARFSSALGVEHFTKKTSLIRYTDTALYREAAHITCLARIEGLEAHARAVEIRTKHKNRTL